MLRPGFELTQRDDIDTFLAEAPFIVPSKKKITDYSVTGEVEVEVNRAGFDGGSFQRDSVQTLRLIPALR